MGGSNGLKQYIKTEKLCKNTNLRALQNKVIAIDSSGVIHRAKIHSGNDKWFLQIINLIHKFSKYMIKPIFIFDGRPSIEKKNTIDQRKNRQDRIKQKITEIIECNLILDNDKSLKKTNLSKQVHSVLLEDIEICKQICIYFGIPFIHIKSLEADDIFPYLINEGIVNGVYSEDNDMFRRCCNTVYFGLDFNLDTIYEFNYDEFIIKENITKEQFNDAFDSSGTDCGTDNLEYCKFPQTIKLIKEYGNLENVIANLDKINEGKQSRIIKVPKQFDFIKVREIFNRKLSEIVIKQIKDSTFGFESLFDKVKLNYKDYSKILFDNIEKICENNICESKKYIYQTKEYYKNVYDIYL